MSQIIECQADRRGRTWVAHIPEYGVYGHGRTLTAVRASAVQGLALVGVTAQVTITPVAPELEALRQAAGAHEAALREAVTALALRRTTVRDIALATGVPAARVKLLLAEHSTSAVNCPTPVDHLAQLAVAGESHGPDEEMQL